MSSVRAQENSFSRLACRTSYRFDGFISHQCLCITGFLFIWLNGMALSKIYSSDLLCSTAGLRFAKSTSPFATTVVFSPQEYQKGIDKRVSELKFSAGPFPSICYASAAAFDQDLLFLLYFLPPHHGPLDLA